METIPWRTPWHSIEGEVAARASFEAELRRELPRGHVLYGRPAHAIGRRRDCDDVLFVLEGPGPAYAVVHLTYCGGQEVSPHWPSTRLFGSISELVAGCIEPDAVDFAVGDEG